MTIEERLEKLEEEVSRLTALVGEGAAKEVRARKFVLEDENGGTCAMLGVAEDSPGLVLYDEDGKRRVVLSVSAADNAPVLVLLDENGKARVQMTAVGDGPNLTLSDGNGKPRAGFNVSDNMPSLVLLDENGITRAQLSAVPQEEDTSTLMLYGKNGEMRVSLLAQDDCGKVALHAENGEIIWGAPSD